MWQRYFQKKKQQRKKRTPLSARPSLASAEREEGGTVAAGREEGGTDVAGREEGGTEVAGREEGGTEMAYKEGGVAADEAVQVKGVAEGDKQEEEEEEAQEVKKTGGNNGGICTRAHTHTQVLEAVYVYVSTCFQGETFCIIVSPLIHAQPLKTTHKTQLSLYPMARLKRKPRYVFACTCNTSCIHYVFVYT